MLLDDTNYTSWKADIQQRLRDQGLLAVTLGNERMPEPDGTNEKAMTEFKKKSRLAFYLLIKSIDDSVMLSVSALDFENNPQDLWNALRLKYLPEDLNGKLEAMRGLKSIKYKNNPDEFIEKIRGHFDQIERAGFNFDETTWMVLFLSQLPRHLTNAIIGQSDQDGASIDSDHASISSCAQLFEKLHSLTATPTNQLPNQKFNDQPQHIAPPALGNKIYTCTHCNKTGHDINRCWFLHPERNPFYKSKDQGPASDGWTAAPHKRFYQGNQPNEPPGPNKYFNKNNNHFHNNHHQSFTSNNPSNTGGNEEWTSSPNKPFEKKEEARKQFTSNQLGWNDTPPVSSTPSNNETGWNDTAANSVGATNESGWIDNVHDFQTLASPSGWGDQQP
ncbi:uncharacterized protein VP01_3874g1 [Puccinia sorghi]|uniref:Retrotransposon Copia-like N-terminal domain-containing protein n=1 Tax=Puccinia sorghi TaxID=27349 RepID=A0A0L6USY0_9BASI|nr:uncharacterized protein VP01_3874g1 [Puccinia sorghi]